MSYIETSTGSLLILQTVCNSFTGSGGTICSQWDTYVQIQALHFFYKAGDGLMLFGVLLLILEFLFIFTLWGMTKWFWKLIAGKWKRFYGTKNVQ